MENLDQKLHRCFCRHIKISLLNQLETEMRKGLLFGYMGEKNLSAVQITFKKKLFANFNSKIGNKNCGKSKSDLFFATKVFTVCSFIIHCRKVNQKKLEMS